MRPSLPLASLTEGSCNGKAFSHPSCCCRILLRALRGYLLVKNRNQLTPPALNLLFDELVSVATFLSRKPVVGPTSNVALVTRSPTPATGAGVPVRDVSFQLVKESGFTNRQE
jgi:hypothetical protein